MTPIKSAKDKGSGFERDLVKILNEKIKDAIFNRVPGSGAIGTIMKEGLLTADVTGKVRGLSKPIKIECKVGYGGATQMTVKKEWFDKVIMQSAQTYSIPLLAGKFSGARRADGVQIFVAMDVDTFTDILNTLTDYRKELDLLYEEKNG